MESTLTVKLDSGLVRRAKARAKKRGISVSALVEAGVRAELGERAHAPFRKEDLPPITRSLCGSLKGARFDRREYADYLDEKYR